MQAIPSALQSRFEASLRNRAVPIQLHGEYKKWLRYYLDYCHKYRIPPDRNGSQPGLYVNYRKRSKLMNNVDKLLGQ